MSSRLKVMENTCRTCLSYFNQKIGKNSLLTCSAITKESNRLELMKNVMTTCSLTLFSNEDETSEVFVCTTCVMEINSMLNFLEKCIHSDAVLRQAVEVKEDISCWTQENSENILKPKVEIKMERVEENVSEKNVSFDSDDVPLSFYLKRKKQKHECLKCSKAFSSSLQLDNKCKFVSCNFHTHAICNDTFQTQRNIKKHMKNKHGDTECQSFLNDQYPDMLITQNHSNIFDETRPNAKVYYCSVCKRFFSKDASLKRHINTHSENHDEKNTPGIQTKKFNCEDRKKQSKSQEKKEKLRNYECPDCDKKFRHLYALKNHTNTHTGIKPFLCNVCGASFSALSNLNSHSRRVHSEERQPPARKYLCHSCGESFARAFHLKRHSLRKHVPNAEKKYECPICKKKFLEKSDVTGHLKLHDDTKPFVCNQCTKSFRTSWRLQAHVKRVHLGLRPFECPTCTLKFKTKSHLRKHIRTHTGEKPFPCPNCSYTCAEKSNLKKHMKIHLKTL